jgi:uncharacterized protein YecE (DUF72 family)
MARTIGYRWAWFTSRDFITHIAERQAIYWTMWCSGGWHACLRLARCGAESVTNYSDRALGRWAEPISAWSRGDEPSDAIKADPQAKLGGRPRAVYCFFDCGGSNRKRAEWQLRTQYLEFSALFPPH